MAKEAVIVSELPPGAVAESHNISTLVEVLDGGGVIRTISGEAVSAGSVTMNSRAESRASFSLDVADDGTGDFIYRDADSLLAPYAHEIRVSKGVETATHIYVVRLGVFRIDRANSRSDETTQIDGNDRSGRLQRAKILEPLVIDAGTNATAGIQSILVALGYAGETDFVTVTAPLPELLVEEGSDGWRDAQGIAEAIGCELYFDREGVLALRPVPSAAQGSPVAEIAEGEGGILIAADRAGDRDLITNHWTVTGENPSNPDGPVPRAVAADLNSQSPTYVFGPFGRQADTFSSEFIASEVQAEDAANGLLAKTLGAPDVISFDTVPDPSRSPGDVIRITERKVLGLDSEDHLVDAITHPLDPGGAMTGNTRVAQSF